MMAQGISEFLVRGGPALWVIAVLSVLTLALILWKFWDLARLGAWSRASCDAAVGDWQQNRRQDAIARLARRNGLRARVVRRAMETRLDADMSDAVAREETQRVGKLALMQARRGLRALELIATIAPLIGLLGTVLGMIEAFQALQAAGNRADPAALAGGIWQALLTTAAGMAVAIPAAMALSWFESIVDRVQADLEDLATRIFITVQKGA
ncbi:MotA/TolQ/ExbB proton channel family protein [Roseinatronobacter sp. NSM]|uniref:MotA/TolQ/ExbB proton channel family protein n=1 Tax=Roseinatronobacter sp. NSM TaxID=3457785 RepID=UPI004035F9A3